MYKLFKLLTLWNSWNHAIFLGRGSCGWALVAILPPWCAPTLRKIFFPVQIWISLLWFLSLVPSLFFHVYCDRLYPGSRVCPPQNWICRCVRAHHNGYSVLTLAVDTVGKLVRWVHLEVESSLVYMKVNGQRGWHMPWQSGRLHIPANLLCSSGMSRLWRHSLYCTLSWWLWLWL